MSLREGGAGSLVKVIKTAELFRIQPRYFFVSLITADSFGDFGPGNHPAIKGERTFDQIAVLDTHDLWAPAKMMFVVVKIEARSQECETG